jgi:hypothetical protein
MGYSRFAADTLGRMVEEVVIDGLGREVKEGQGKLLFMPRRKSTRRARLARPGQILPFPRI